MISDAASYVANRLTETAAERLGPTIAWGMLIAMSAMAAVAFGLVALYAYLSPIYGELQSAAGIAAGAFLLVVILMIGRKINRKIQQNIETPKSDVEQTLHSIDAEATEAIDYFGSAKVLATAFMFGFSAARRIKS